MSQTPKQMRYQLGRKAKKEKKAATIKNIYSKLTGNGLSREQAIPEIMLKLRVSYPTVLRALK